jgi:predicted nucleic-acid-binding protein
MLGVDTNVLVRYITDDDPVQSQVARRAIERAALAGERLRICVPVLCELAWVLGNSPYGYSRNELADTFELLLEADALEVEARDLVRTAAAQFRRGTADFTDYLLGGLNRSSGCRATLTFDLAAGDSDLFEVLRS